MCKGNLAIFKLLLHNALKDWYSVFIPFVSFKSGNLFFNLPYSFQWFKVVIVGPKDFDDETLHGTLLVMSTRLKGLENKNLDNIVRKIVHKIDQLPIRLEQQVNWTIGKAFKRLTAEHKQLEFSLECSLTKVELEFEYGQTKSLKEFGKTSDDRLNMWFRRSIHRSFGNQTIGAIKRVHWPNSVETSPKVNSYFFRSMVDISYLRL